MNIKLDEQEQELVDSYNRGEWQSIATPENLATYKQIAQNTSSNQLDNYLPVIIAAEYLHDYTVKLTFDNGQQKIADCLQWLNGEVFEPLKDKSYFQTFFLDGWSIAWSNGADIAPETLYENSETVIS